MLIHRLCTDFGCFLFVHHQLVNLSIVLHFVSVRYTTKGGGPKLQTIYGWLLLMILHTTSFWSNVRMRMKLSRVILLTVGEEITE